MPRTLGIDPGLRLTGYALLDAVAASPLAEPSLVEAGVLRLDARASVEARLAQLHRDLKDIIEEHSPSTLAVEKIFSHYKHPRTAILMGHARGVILLTAQEAGLEIVHLPSTEVKKSVTGHGHASKEQVGRAVQSVFHLAEPPSPHDVSDALAIALCHARRVAWDQ